MRHAAAAGDLPPVDERIPIEPMVLEPFESIGKYGGSLVQLAPGTGGQHELKAQSICNPRHQCGCRPENLQPRAQMPGEHVQPGQHRPQAVFLTDMFRAGAEALFTAQGDAARIQQIAEELPAGGRFETLDAESRGTARASGTSSSIDALVSSLMSLSGHRMAPGDTPFTRTSGASSFASTRVSMARPAFAGL